KFNPNGYLTREQAFTFLWRAYFSEQTDDPAEFLASFTDGGSVSKYAREAVAVLIEKGVVNGSGSRLLPKNRISRAELAKLLCVSMFL
ncbi:MAG: S-layer homology domain-containing protein, partial [Oscillospiraceae bacterium]|nr:S-layer homology domain-containing protein [Oscillospiraceae bacterium]